MLDYRNGDVDRSGDRSRYFLVGQILISFLTCTAALAIINLVMFLIPSKATYFETTSAVLGKLYSNTLMVLLNSRMVYGISSDTMSDKVSPIVSPKKCITSKADASVTHEWSDPLEHPLEDFKMVSVAIQPLISILNLRLGG